MLYSFKLNVDMYVLLEGAWAPNCLNCQEAKKLLDSCGVSYVVIRIDESEKTRFNELIMLYNTTSGILKKISMPQIFDVTLSKEFESFDEFEAFVNADDSDIVEYVGGLSDLKTILSYDDIED